MSWIRLETFDFNVHLVLWICRTVCRTARCTTNCTTNGSKLTWWSVSLCTCGRCACSRWLVLLGGLGRVPLLAWHAYEHDRLTAMSLDLPAQSHRYRINATLYFFIRLKMFYKYTHDDGIKGFRNTHSAWTEWPTNARGQYNRCNKRWDEKNVKNVKNVEKIKKKR